ncbi:ornithine cyclodeaminase family protein [Brevibacterium jeotgali]|uniref:Ornithine cyclodeaminase n=1 Tax=Brevibacterium jeotgali TaxID=1262550 RepID=A0A2H1L568_9MICO|nr:ornithine cyclodeaminase family protein [Brevibacterium jeotgali]TWC01495.1 ornithine cyclodeaminase [Brevibacterium jeotgali]SMY11900.1 ornithine cyclodeaminase [Brevibacterium jeotgali]
MTIRVVDEAVSRELVDEALALESAREAFIAAVTDGTVYPVVVAPMTGIGHRFTVKSGSSGTSAVIKIGSYWPGNDVHGLSNHGSSVILLHPETGRIRAVVEAAAGNGFRTAAADALAVQTLAREDARVLTVVGTGHQALYEARAAFRVRDFERVLVAGRRPVAAEARAAELREVLGTSAADGGTVGVTIEATSIEAGVRRADVVVTATNAKSPVIEADWVRPGTHVSAMGADGSGKQELAAGLYERGALFCDLPDQARAIGEFSHAAPEAPVTALGAVLTGAAPGRADAEQITVFDSSGFALQDLAFAEAILQRAGDSTG